MPENSHIAGWPKWVTPQAMDRYVYVLTADSVTGDDVVFWAKVEGQTIPVQRRTVSPFLVEHQERIFITHDAVGFHERCVGCVGDEQRQIVWELSLGYRLWDVTLLDWRIHFAHRGYNKKNDSGDALASFLPLLGQVTVASVDECLDALRTCFDGQVRWTLENLPLFRTYSHDIPPTPLTTDEFCDCLDSSLEGIIIYQRYLEELLMPPVGTTHPAQEGVDDEMEDDAEFHSISPSPPASTQDDFAIALAFRRRDVVLTSNIGPFGVGLDVAGAIVKKRIESIAKPQVVLGEARRQYHDISTAIAQTDFKDCFKWQAVGDVTRKKDCLGVHDDKLRNLLEKICQDRGTFFSEPLTFTYPRNSEGKTLTKVMCWVPFLHLDECISQWIQLDF